MNRPEIIALAIIALTLFLLVKYGGLQWWQLLLVVLAVLALEAYVPQVSQMAATAIRSLTSYITTLTHH